MTVYEMVCELIKHDADAEVFMSDPNVDELVAKKPTSVAPCYIQKGECEDEIALSFDDHKKAEKLKLRKAVIISG